VAEYWVLVTASRQWRDRQRMRASLLAVQRHFGAPGAAMGIVHGAAHRGDRLAGDVAVLPVGYPRWAPEVGCRTTIQVKDERQGSWWERGRLWLRISIIVVAAVAFVLVWLLIPPLLYHSVAGSDEARLKAITDTRTALLAGLVGIGALGTFWLNSRVYRITARTLQVTERGQVTDRYSKAIEQLGSATVDVRLGGIYALEQIAKDSDRGEEDQATIVEVLSAFVRVHSDPLFQYKASLGEAAPSEPAEEQRQKAAQYVDDLDGPPIDVQAAVTVLGRLPARPGTALNRADLTRAWLKKANLFEANLTEATLTGANLTEATLTGANLIKATLTGGNLTGAHLNQTNLTGAHLFRANLTKANLSGGDLTGAYLLGVNLTEAHLYETNLTRTYQARRPMAHRRTGRGRDLALRLLVQPPPAA
jgi:hypothetical protein